MDEILPGNKEWSCGFYINTSSKQYALVNYKEIILWYNQPFYMKWFSKCPVKELIEVKR